MGKEGCHLLFFSLSLSCLFVAVVGLGISLWWYFLLLFFYIVLAFIFSCLSVANHLSIFCFSPYFLLLPFRISQTGDSNRLTLGEQPEGMVLNHSATRRTNWGILLVSRELTTLGHRTQ